MTDNMIDNEMDAKLQIYQLNMNKSLTAHSCLINQVDKNDDLILIQEPYIGKHRKSRATQGWMAVYPTRHDSDLTKTRAVTLVN